ncbi:DUF1877 family protein [Streptomyces sp. AC495_CC817]|uniref:DUF1877 family protein n=1 Tax=Streptomyces sp. AC495_CC817 TaxID=2823900 RepID=UPI001C263097
MGSLGEYLRLTAEELERIKRDPDWAWNHMEDVREGEEHFEPGPADALYYASDMAWPLLRVLLGRAGFPVDVSRGEQRIRYAPPGYGDYGCLTAEQVGVRRHPAGVQARHVREQRGEIAERAEDATGGERHDGDRQPHLPVAVDPGLPGERPAGWPTCRSTGSWRTSNRAMSSRRGSARPSGTRPRP